MLKSKIDEEKCAIGDFARYNVEIDTFLISFYSRLWWQGISSDHADTFTELCLWWW